MDGRDIGRYAKKVTTNKVVQATIVVLGVAFTLSTIVSNYHFIKLNRMRIKLEEERLNSNNNQ